MKIADVNIIVSTIKLKSVWDHLPFHEAVKKSQTSILYLQLIWKNLR